MNKANFYYPHTWEVICIQTIENLETISVYVLLCPRCGVLVKDETRHLEWHKSIKDEE